MHACKRRPQVGNQIHVRAHSRQPYGKDIGTLRAFTHPCQIRSKILPGQGHAFVSHSGREGPTADVKCRAHMARQRTRRFNAVACRA